MVTGWTHDQGCASSCEHPVRDAEAVTHSSFSRLADAETCGRLATVETGRRGGGLTREGCAGHDGVVWSQGVVDLHRPDAVRMLDGAHAAGSLRERAALVRAAGIPLPEAWLAQHVQALTHYRPAAVWKEGTRVRQRHPHVPDLDTKGRDLSTCEPHKLSPRSQEANWPRGRMERTTTRVVHARRTGVGLYWGRSPVTPMFALHTAVWNDPWEHAWLQACHQRLLQRHERRLVRQKTRRDAALHPLILHLLLLLCPRRPVFNPSLLLPSLLRAPLCPRLPADQLLTILGAVVSLHKHDIHPLHEFLFHCQQEPATMTKIAVSRALLKTNTKRVRQFSASLSLTMLP